MYLYETHIPVKDTEQSKSFYLEVVGLEFAHRDPTRDIVFLWVGKNRRSMLGLWGPDTVYGREQRQCHLAFAMSLPELRVALEGLRRRQIICRNFSREETAEPSVIGWMPSAEIYFEDPDGHSLEFIALLDEPPDATFIGSLSAWQSRSRA